MSMIISGTGGATFPDSTTQTTAASIATPLTVTGNSTAGAEIRLPEDTDNGSNYVALKAADNLASNVTFTLPSADGTNGQVLQTNGSGALSFTTPAAGFSSLAVLTSGTSWTAPAGVSKIKVTVTGAGSGGSTSPAVVGRCGSGGSAGGTAIKIFTVTPGNSYTYAIGSGGSAGSAGGNTTFTVGAVTITGSGGSAPPGQFEGAVGGTATNGDLNITGGGGGAGVTGATNTTGVEGVSGVGGASYWGGGGAGVSSSSSGNGKNGAAYGSGGSGGASSGSAQTGGTGAQGVIVIEY